jgi:hypothetical protein
LTEFLVGVTCLVRISSGVLAAFSRIEAKAVVGMVGRANHEFEDDVKVIIH